MALKSNAEELALIAQETGAELALEAPLGESVAAQGFWYILLLNSGASSRNLETTLRTLYVQSTMQLLRSPSLPSQ